MRTTTPAVTPTGSLATRSRSPRIASCWDAFNAITTDRSYRKGRSIEEALAYLQARRGTQFDPEIVDSVTRFVSRV